MHQYNTALKQILETGVFRPDRTGIGTYSVFGMQMRFNLEEGFPAVTSKKLAWKSVVSELLWFLEGSGDERRLSEILHGTREQSKSTIWTANANAPYWKPKAKYEGDLGVVYGQQWRKWTDANGRTIDQVKILVDGLKQQPFSRRHIISAWNVAELDNMALPPCHVLSQYYVADGKLSCHLYQRSADFPLGVPFNIASYSLFTHMLAQVCELGVGDFVWSGGDCHIYENQVEGVRKQLEREPLPPPTLSINQDVKDIDAFSLSDFALLNYNHHPAINFEFAV